MIRQVIAAAVLALLPAALAQADTRDVYTIEDIAVDEQAETLIAAREQAMAAARVAGARALIGRITLPADRDAAGGVPVDGALANRLAAAVDVREETAGAGRYRGKLSVIFNPQSVRAHLDALKVPYLDAQAPLALMVPVAGAAGNEAAWREALRPSNKNALVPYVTATLGGHSASSDWAMISSEATSAGARRGILAELQGRDGAWRVVLSTVTAAGNDPVGATPPAVTLGDAAKAVSRLLDESWKQASIVRDGDRTQVTASVLYTSLAEWNTLRAALVRSPLVSDFRTLAVSRLGAEVSFAFAGDAARLDGDLRQRGVAFGQEGGARVLRSAVSASGGQ